jgi:hypothetical protein
VQVRRELLAIGPPAAAGLRQQILGCLDAAAGIVRRRGLREDFLRDLARVGSISPRPAEISAADSRPRVGAQHVGPCRHEDEHGGGRLLGVFSSAFCAPEIIVSASSTMIRGGALRMDGTDVVDDIADLIDLDRSVVAGLDHDDICRCTPRAMREQAAHVPQASRSSPLPAGVRQLIDCATAIAISRMSGPAGPEKIRLGGTRSRATDLASRPASLRCPRAATTSLNGIG